MKRSGVRGRILQGKAGDNYTVAGETRETNGARRTSP